MTPGAAILQELLVLVLFGASGTGLAWMIGARSVWLMISLGALLGTLLRTLSFSALNLFSFRGYDDEVWAGLSLAALVFIALFGWRSKVGARALWAGLGVATVLAGLAVISTRVIGFVGVPHGDSRWIMAIVDLLNGDADMTTLNGRTSIKRGFSYPLLLSLGPDGEYLSGLTPYLFMALAAAIIWVASQLLRGKSALIIAGSAAVLAAAIFTATVPLRTIFYINGHTLTALGLTLAAGAIALAVRDAKLSPLGLATVAAGFAVASTTRPEAIALAALISLPLISTRWISRWQIAAVITSALLPLGLWLAVVNSYILSATDLWWPVFVLLLVGAGLLATLPILDWFRFRLVPIAIGSMILVIIGALIVFRNRLLAGVQAQWDNLIIGEGLWGYIFLGFVLAFLLIGVRGLSAEYRTLLALTVLVALGLLISKMLDGGQFGQPTLGRVGWSDSLNRMWIHGFGIFLLALLTGLVERWERAVSR